MSNTTREQAYRRWKKGEDQHDLAKEMGVTRERMRHILKKMDENVPLVDRIEELEANLAQAVKSLERQGEAWANALELDIIAKQHRWSAQVLRDEARATLAELKGGDG